MNIDKEFLLREIDRSIHENGAREITGKILNRVLNDIVDKIFENIPTLYTENVSAGEASIAASLFRVTSEGFIITTSNSTLIFNEEEGLIIRSGSKDLLKVSPTILEANIGRLHFEMSGGTFTFSINDGSSDYVITFDESNGIVMADVNIQATLEDLQRQIDELKNVRA
jgi:hypothetical protein